MLATDAKRQGQFGGTLHPDCCAIATPEDRHIAAPFAANGLNGLPAPTCPAAFQPSALRQRGAGRFWPSNCLIWKQPSPPHPAGTLTDHHPRIASLPGAHRHFRAGDSRVMGIAYVPSVVLPTHLLHIRQRTSAPRSSSGLPGFYVAVGVRGISGGRAATRVEVPTPDDGTYSGSVIVASKPPGRHVLSMVEFRLGLRLSTSCVPNPFFDGGCTTGPPDSVQVIFNIPFSSRACTVSTPPADDSEPYFTAFVANSCSKSASGVAWPGVIGQFWPEILTWSP